MNSKKVSRTREAAPAARRSKTVKGRGRLPKALAKSQVFAACPTTQFRFKSTKELEPSDEIISQERATKAIEVGLGIRKSGYNIFVAGYHGTGKTTVIKTFLERWAKTAKAPDDWIYVHDFDHGERPRAIALPAGKGKDFCRRLEAVIKSLAQEIPQALQSEAYENSVNARISQNNDKQSRRFGELEKLAKQMNFQIKSTRVGIETIPVVDGRPLTEKEYAKLSEGERSAIEKQRSKLEPQVLDFARHVRQLELEAKEFVEQLQREIVENLLSELLTPLDEAFAAEKELAEYLRRVRSDILENITEFHDDELDDSGAATVSMGLEQRERFRRYRVNLFVDNSATKGAPIVIESNPSYYNLFGKVEKNIDHGMFYTDFTMIKAGAIHRANGGYLLIEASDVFKMPSVWDTLKRMLRSGTGFIEDMGEQFSMFPTSGIRPEAIKLDVKVILIGSDDIYHMLFELDDEFPKIFRIKADFDYKMPRNQRNVNAYARFIATRCHREDLLHFDRSGVAAVVEYSSRMIEDQSQLSTQFGEIKDLTIQADFLARSSKAKMIGRKQVEEALEQKFNRVNLIEEHLLESIARGDVMISTAGAVVGQVNGLAVYEMGDYAFGKPGRITCTVAANDDGIVNIERSTKLSGNIHDKGVLILSGFLNALLARRYALGMSASVCFEQSYGLIDGDSATVAELIAIISALAEIPVSQAFSITGSLNQFGELQPVGGINEKIEGFLKVCLAMKVSDDFRLVIPSQNVSNLMLSAEAREAVAEGVLKIYTVQYFWQAFELVTDHSFGAHSIHDDPFAEGSALQLIQARLDELQDEERSGGEDEKESAPAKERSRKR